METRVFKKMERKKISNTQNKHQNQCTSNKFRPKKKDEKEDENLSISQTQDTPVRVIDLRIERSPTSTHIFNRYVYVHVYSRYQAKKNKKIIIYGNNILNMKAIEWIAIGNKYFRDSRDRI